MKYALIILAAGASSRMKRSQASSLTQAEMNEANTVSKALLRVGHDQRPILDYLLINAEQAGYMNIYLVIPPNNTAFSSYYSDEFGSLKIAYAIQSIPDERSKPMGTGDAILQTMGQYPELCKQVFTVCNSDNLYSVAALKLIRKDPSQNALIAYDRDGLKFPFAKIAAFALLEISSEGYLIRITEKPKQEEALQLQDSEGTWRVSMNLWKLNGSDIFQFLENLEPHPVRKEKELPTAIQDMIRAFPKKVKALPICEHVPDLTSKEDIAKVKEYLKEHYNFKN